MSKIGPVSHRPWGFYCVVLITAICLVTLSGCTLLPGLSVGRRIPVAEPEAPHPALPEQEVVVYYTGAEGSIPSSESVLRQHAEKISCVTGFWYQIDSQNPARLNSMANSPEDSIRATVDLAHSNGVKVEALIHNLLYGSSSTSRAVIEGLLGDSGLTAQLADNLVLLVQRMQFDGVNIDIEFVSPQSRHSFTRFVQVISDRLHREGVRVSISVPAKTGDDPTNGWAGGYDYAALGAMVDRVMLMTYDEYGATSAKGGPIASSGWVRRVVEYASQQVPASKLLVGIPAYGFRWTEGTTRPVYLDYPAAMAPVQYGEAELSWDEAGKVPMYKYTDTRGATHEVWFENASSSTWKLDLIREFGLRGFALWRAGMEDPNFWQVVGQKMRAEK